MVEWLVAMVCLSPVEVVVAGLITSTDFLDGESGGKASPKKCAQLVSFYLPLGIRGPERAVKQMVRARPSASWFLLL